MRRCRSLVVAAAVAVFFVQGVGDTAAIGAGPGGAEELLQVAGATIMRFDARTGASSQLISQPGYAISSASWSPDGRRVAFSDVYCAGTTPCASVRWRIRVMNVADGRVRTVKKVAAAWIGEVSWAPRGGHIAYSSFTAFTPTLPPVIVNEVHVMKEDGTQARPIGLGWGVAWHPSGKRLTYREQASGTLLTTDLGGKPRRSTPAGYTAWFPEWSRDGSRISFIGGSTLGGSDVHVVGPNRRPLSLGAGGTSTSWSPDSRAVVVSVGHAVEVVDVATGSRRVLELPGYSPVWSPSGALIAANKWGVIHIGDAASGRLVQSFHSGSTEPLHWRPRP